MATKSYPFLVFDTEDNAPELQKAGISGFKKQVTQIAAKTAGGDTFYNRGNTKEFLQWLKRRKERFFYAHNLQYDLGNLFGRELEALDVTLVGGRIIRAVWCDKVFVDSFNIWPMAAKTIGDKFGLAKLKMDIYSKEYVFRDVEIILRAMLFAWEFTTHLGIKLLPATLGGLCIKVWKHWGGNNCHDSTDLSREAYYGGRVEIFKARNESKHVCWTDINSLYPYVMQNEYPGMLEQWDCEDGKLPPYGIVNATVSVPKQDLVVLPFRNDESRIIFPWGKFTGTWTVPELREAMANGTRIVKIHKAMGTTEAMRPYGTFVVRLYESRLASKSEAEKLFFKLLMNNLYGRLGTTGTIGRTVYQTEKNSKDGVPYGDKVLVAYQMPLAEETNWAHAAYVTAYGRIALFRYMQKVGAQRLIYCDTDSLIFDCDKGRRRGPIPFQVGDALGQMKLVSWESECMPYLPKLYKIGNHYKAKGVPKRLAKTFFETGRAEFDLPYKIREAIRFYDRKNVRRLSVWHKVEKVRRENYDRKNLLGNRFYPCKIQST